MHQAPITIAQRPRRRTAWRLHCTALLLAWVGHAAAELPAAPACPPTASVPSATAIQAAAANARDRGALWRLSRDGRSAYLYGSIHVGRFEWAFPGPQLRSALSWSDTLAVEIDLADAQMLARLAPPAGVEVPTLDAALRERLARQVALACLPPKALDSLHPVIQAITLGVLAARWQGLDVAYAQELVLGGYARAAGRRIVSLETPELQMAALVPRQAAAAERMLRQNLEQLERDGMQRVIARLASAWERGDLTDLESYEAWCECVSDEAERRLMQALLDERNPGLADGIEALHRQGARVVAAVGILHLTGAVSVQALLQARGFKLERVTFK